METAFIWNDNFITGIESVDEQHQTIVRLFNELHWALFLQEGERDGILSDVYGRLLAYTEYHYQEEEEMMLRFGVDSRHFQPHAQAHQQFIEQLRVLWAQRSVLCQPDNALVGFLTSWLGLHILSMDQSMARQIKALQMGASAEEAFAAEEALHNQGMPSLLDMMGQMYSALSAQNVQLSQTNQTLEERIAQHTHALEAAHLRLKTLARTDPLLGIANRAYFNERLEHTCALAVRGERPVGVVLIDVDCFKSYNHRHGHLQGDVCLQTVTKAVHDTLHRSTDLLARYGGAELVVLLPDTHQAGAQGVARRIVQAVHALQMPHEDSPVSPFITVSAGVCAQIPYAPAQGGSGSAALMQGAESALARAKAGGRNRDEV